MTTQTHKVEQNVVKDLRKIREAISNEIKDMSFEEERAYLDKLLTRESKPVANEQVAKSNTIETK